MKPESAAEVHKTRLLTLFVIVANVAGNLALSRGMREVGQIVSASPLDYARAFTNPWTVAGVGILAVCNTLGDVLNTAGMKRQGEVEELGPRSLAQMVAGIFHNPMVLGGLAALTVSFFALLSLLSIASVSFAIPATAVSYLLETALA